jgi:predicted nucleotidyltransferase/uncharacterized protein (UPF0332 family)|tara:strand:- start:337 stop:1206 length:870 start_codon:yes stop_codon:yes gene_type:complete
MVKAKNKEGSKDRPKVIASKKSKPPTMLLSREREIAMDFALKVYKEFDQMIKSVILFGSTAKKKSKSSSDIDILVIIDDVGIRWDMELVAWYREELAKLIKANPYVRPLHINTMKLSTWWEDMMRGDPVVLNVIRYGDALVDFGGFFNPLKILMARGKIKSTPEAVYTLLQRSPRHMARASQSLLAAVDGLYWTMIDSAHAALISANIEPASPENVAEVMKNTFVEDGSLNKKYVKYYEEVHGIAKEIIHGKRVSVGGKELEKWFSMTDDFLGEMARLVDDILEKKRKS